MSLHVSDPLTEIRQVSLCSQGRTRGRLEVVTVLLVPHRYPRGSFQIWESRAQQLCPDRRAGMPSRWAAPALPAPLRVTARSPGERGRCLTGKAGCPLALPTLALLADSSETAAGGSASRRPALRRLLAPGPLSPVPCLVLSGWVHWELPRVAGRRNSKKGLSLSLQAGGLTRQTETTLTGSVALHFPPYVRATGIFNLI